MFKKFLAVWMASLALLAGSAVAADLREGCDSCRIQIKSLDKPIKLVGKWLFTREDKPEFKDVEVDTTDWKLVMTPGPWTKVYDDKKIYRVGWYRGTLEFDPSLIGQEVVFLVDPLQARMTAYLDGEEVFRRPGKINVDRYYMMQPVPIRFKITKTEHVIAMRVDTQIMVGIVQLPLEIRKYTPTDTYLSFHALAGGELRLVTGFVSMFFGLFFLLVYSKTKAPMYWKAGMAALFYGVYFSAQNDAWLRFVSPELVMYLATFSLAGALFVWLFTQHFHKVRSNKLNVTVTVFTMVMSFFYVFVGLVLQNLELLSKIRPPVMLMVQVLILLSVYQTARGTWARQPGALLLFLGILSFFVTFVHDAMIFAGIITSKQIGFGGTVAMVGAMLYVAIMAFADTFLENRRLVTDLKAINDNLEGIVAERTQQLREKSKDIQAMLENMPQGVLTVVQGDLIHPEYSAYLEEIFETKDIAGKNVMDVIFGNATLGSDARDQLVNAIAACIGEDSMNYEFNQHLLVTACDVTLPSGHTKSLDLNWSAITNDDDVVEKLMLCVRDVTELRKLEAEAGQQKRELEIIGQILAVNQEKFHEFVDGAATFISENRSLIESAVHGSKADLELLTQLFRNMHTIKGNARTYGLLHLTNLVHETEQAYDELRKNPDASFDKDALLEQLAQTHDAIAEYAKINEVKLGRKGPGRRGSVEKFLMVEKEQIEQAMQLMDGVDANNPAAMQQVLKQVRHTLHLFGTESIQSVLSGVIGSLPSLAKELGKEAPQTTIDSHGVVIRTQVADLLRNVFMHLYRNSMDHGIETPDKRVAAGKPAAGHIWLDVSLTGDRVVFRLKDDGKGLAVSYIRQKALEKGLITADQNVSPEQVAQFIFAAGFSTAAKVTEVSGRGVGMDAVKGFVERESGTIELVFTSADTGGDFRPFETVISLPGKFAVLEKA